MNSCGNCTACCKAMGVVEIDKEPGVWCAHCAVGEGCRIYADRPPSCAGFQCAWLMEGLPADLRPDISKVVLVPAEDNESVVVKMDAMYPEAHRRGGVRKYLKTIVAAGKVVFIVADFRNELPDEVWYSSAALNNANPEMLRILTKMEAAR